MTALTHRPVLRIGRFQFYVCDRLFEWQMAVLMLSASVFLLWPGVEVTGAMKASGLPVSALAVFFAMFGAIRTFALLANGNIPEYGPRARAVCALVSGPLWAVLGLAQLLELIQHDRLSLALPIYFSMTAAEIYSAYRATCDVGRRH